MMLVERYLAICNPLAGSVFNIQLKGFISLLTAEVVQNKTGNEMRINYRYVSRKMNLKEQSMIASFCCWVWSFIWCLLPLVGWNSYVLEGIGTSCAPNWYAQDGIKLRLKYKMGSISSDSENFLIWVKSSTGKRCKIHYNFLHCCLHNSTDCQNLSFCDDFQLYQGIICSTK